MKTHGFWELYKPENPPSDAPPNAWYWRNGEVDWYDYSRSLPTGKYVVLIGDRIVSAGNDATRLTIPEKFQLIETDADFSLGDRLIDGVVVPLHTEFSMQPLSARQLWLMAREAGIYKANVLQHINAMTDEEEKEILLIQFENAPLAGYLRDSPAMEKCRELMGISSEQFDDMWIFASQFY